jgi:hypothetical protein
MVTSVELVKPHWVDGSLMVTLLKVAADPLGP